MSDSPDSKSLLRRVSIAVPVGAALAVVATVILGTYAYASYVHERESALGALRERSAIEAREVAVSLSLPLWDFDDAQTASIIASVMSEPSIYAVVVRRVGTKPPDGYDIETRVRDSAWGVVESHEDVAAGDLLADEQPVVHGTEQVGLVRLLSTPRFVERELERRLTLQAAMLVGFDVALVASLCVALWPLVFRPLRAMEGYLAAVSAGDRLTAAVPRGVFVGELRVLRSSAAAMVAQLRERYEELRASEERFRFVVEHTSDWFVRLAPDGSHICDSPSVFRHRTGVTLESLVGRTWRDFAHPDDLPTVETALAAALAGTEPVTCEYRRLLSDGTYLWVEATAVSYRDSVSGEATEIHVVARDTDRRKRAEIALKERERELSTILRAAPVGVLLVADRVVRATNPAVWSLTGYTEDELRGRDSRVFFASQEEYDRVGVELLAYGGQALRTTQATVVTKNGEAKSFLLTSGALDPEEPEAGSVVVALDVSERQRAEERLRRYVSGLRQVVDITSELLRVSDTDLLIRRAVELARERLGAERCGVFVWDGATFRGTYGTDASGQTVDEHEGRIEVSPEELLSEYHSAPAAAHEGLVWALHDGPHGYFRGKTSQVIGQGWVAKTPLAGLHGLVGVIYNDCAISGRPVDPALQDVLAVYGSVLGVLIEQARARADLEDTRRASEQRIRESERRFREMADLLPGIVFECNLEGNLTYSNLPGLREFGYTQGDLDAGLALLDLVSAADRDRGRERFAQAAMQATDSAPFSGEYQVTRRDGSEFPAVVYTSAMERDGHPVGIRGIVINIAERKQAEAAWREAMQRYEAVFSAANDAILLMEGDRFIDCNPKALEVFGCTREQLVGATPVAFSPPAQPDGRPSVDAARQRIAEAWDGRPQRFEWLHMRPSHEQFAAEVALSRFDLAGKTYIQAIVRDISERKRAEAEILRLNEGLELRVRERTAELEASNRELDAFSRSVAHDLRGPLRGIDGWSLALLEDYGDKLDAQALEYLATVRSETQRMGALIDALLQLSRVTRAGIQRESVCLSDIVADILVGLHRAEPDRVVETVVEPGLSCWADPILTQALLRNLVENAWKFTATRVPARIEFGMAVARGELVYFVRDNGVGFQMAQADRLFAPFQRLHRVEEFAGTGVGLACVQRIVDRHGGRVWAEAEEDRGATFRFTIGSQDGPQSNTAG